MSINLHHRYHCYFIYRKHNVQNTVLYQMLENTVDYFMVNIINFTLLSTSMHNIQFINLALKDRNA